MYPKHVELRIRQPFASSWHFKLFQMEHIIYSLVHKYVLRTPQNMQCVSIRKTNRWVLCRAIIAVCCKSRMIITNALCEQRF